MDHLLLAILALSITAQFTAAFMAARLIRLSGALFAWILISGGFFLQGVRRCVSLVHALNGRSEADVTAEIIALLISLVMLGGVLMIAPLFTRLKDAHREVIRGRDELEKTHQELVASETRYRTVAEFTSDWEFWVAPDRSVRYISPSCAQVSGYSAEEFYADPDLIFTIVHPEDLPRYQGHTHVLQGNGHPQAIDFRIVTKGGETRWISHVCRSVTDEDGSPLGFRASNRDITDRKRMELILHEHAVKLEAEVRERQRAQEDLAAKQSQLEALNRTLEERIESAVAELREKDQLMISQSRHAAMGEMIDYIAHQWKSPLNNLGLIMQNVSHEYGTNLLTPEQMETYSAEGMELITYMSQTIDDFRDFFREDKVKLTFSARGCLSRALLLVEASLKDNDIAVVVEPGEDVLISGYRNEYAQALLNLLGNARDALLEKGVADPAIRIAVSGAEGRSVVTIRDNAGGIPEEHLERIFEPYFTTKEEGKGSGVGLSMTKSIVEKSMGGRLSVRNVEGGAEFTIEV